MKLAFFWFILILIWFILAYFLSESDLFFCHRDGNTGALGQYRTRVLQTPHSVVFLFSTAGFMRGVKP